MKQKRSHDAAVIERKHVLNKPTSAAQSQSTDALDTATVATDADVQVMLNLLNPCSTTDFLQYHSTRRPF